MERIACHQADAMGCQITPGNLFPPDLIPVA